MGSNCCGPATSSGTVTDIPKKRKGIYDKEDQEEANKDLHIVEESVAGVEGDKRKPQVGAASPAEDNEKHATKSYKSEPIQWEVEKEGQYEGSNVPVLNQEGSNATSQEAGAKVREGTEIQFTEASLKIASVAEVEQVSVEPQTEASELKDAKQEDDFQSHSLTDEDEQQEFASRANSNSVRLIRFSCRNLARGDETDRKISEVLNQFCEIRPRSLSSMSFIEETEETKGLTEAEKMQRALALAKELLPDLITEMITFLPVVKLSTSTYLIGTKEKQVQLKETGCVVRTGGGFMQMEEFLRHYCKSECIQLNNLIKKGDGKLKTTVLSLLHKHKADKKQIASYERRYNPEVEQQFERLMEEFKEVDRIISENQPASPRKVAPSSILQKNPSQWSLEQIKDFCLNSMKVVKVL